MNKPRRIIVYHIGSLGDTLVALPALWAVREYFGQAHLTLLCDRQGGKSYVLAEDILEGTGIFDQFLVYTYDPSVTGKLLMTPRLLSLLVRLRLHNSDTLVYLASSRRTDKQMHRDRRFFTLAGVKQFIGMDYFSEELRQKPCPPLRPVMREADFLLDRIRRDGIPALPLERARKALALGPRDEASLQDWLSSQPPSGPHPWVGVGPGSMMPLKIWPQDRYLQVLRRLAKDFDVWPVFLGGKEDYPTGQHLIEALGRGYNGAGCLSVRQSAQLLSHCRMFLGNDTGTMHLAAATGVRCVAIFSGRDLLGKWDPLGQGHIVLRKRVECEGCLLYSCIQQKMRCIKGISVEEVYDACCSILRTC
jgi:ADP-heptose:LPS heptosyltransferase